MVVASEMPLGAEVIPVSVLTGFLGSGKTTILNHLVRQPALRDTLVLINEFGEIGIDHDLVSESRDDLVVEMSSGCLCCTIRGDLSKSLREATWRFARQGKPWFRRVVIETTGLADPAPILHTLMTEPAIARRYRLDGVITTVDAVNGADTIARQPEAAKQAAVADRLLITKTDLATVAAIEQLHRRLSDLNAAAPRLPVSNGSVDAEALFGVGLFDPGAKHPDVQAWLRAEAVSSHAHHDHLGHDVNRHDQRIRAVCLTLDRPMAPSAFEAWLETLLLFRGADLLRVKGVINVAGLEAPVVIHGVQHVFHPAVALERWPSADRRTRIVFITRNMDEDLLRSTLKPFHEDGLTSTSQRP